MKRHLRLFISIILIAVLVISIANLSAGWFTRQESADAASLAAELAGQSTRKERILPDMSVAMSPAPETEPTEPTEPKIYWTPAPVEDDPVMDELAQIDLESLRQESENVIGWLHIPGTIISYPLMQGEDNGYYLEHTWNDIPNVYGSLFLECKNSSDFMDFNTIIYGHNTSDGSMFSHLINYSYESFLLTHPYIYLVTDHGVLRYEVFATYLAPVDSSTYGLSFNQQSTREEFIAWSLENTLVETGITPGIHDRIITLSTCTGYGYESRRVVQARLEMIPTYGT